MSERELYNYKLWQEILIIKDVRSRDDHLEIIGNILEKDTKPAVVKLAAAHSLEKSLAKIRLYILFLIYYCLT